MGYRFVDFVYTVLTLEYLRKMHYFEGECIQCINYYTSHIKYMAYGKINVTRP